MTTEQIIWTVVIVLAVLVLIGLIVAAMRKKGQESKRAHAQEIRQEAAGGAAGLPDAQARAEQVRVQAEHKRFEAERAEQEALAARTEVEQQRARHEDQVREADRLDPDVDHQAKDYSPQVADPAGPSNVPTDPAYADPDTGRVAGTRASSTSDPDTVFDSDDHTRQTSTTATGTTSTSTTADGATSRISDEPILHDHPTDGSTPTTRATDDTGTDLGGTHRA